MHFQGVAHAARHAAGVDSQLVSAQAVAMAEAVRHRPFITARKTLNKGSPGRLPLEVGAQSVSSAGAVPERWQLQQPRSPALHQVPLLPGAIPVRQRQ